MKKATPFLIAGVILALLVLLMVSTANNSRNRVFDETISLRQGDRIPYGTSAARQLLPSLFPGTNLYFDRKYPGAWDSLDLYRSGQAIILVADYFEADEVELENLSDFVEKGNYVFIIMRNISDDAAAYFSIDPYVNYLPFYSSEADSLQVQLVPPAFPQTPLYTYPGQKYESYLTDLDTSRVLVLGKNDEGHPNFIRMEKGAGSFFIHTAPLAFSNYFILHKNNSAYFETALSVLPKNTSSILWNEYFLEKPRSKEENGNGEEGWLNALFNQPAFKWGLLTAAATLLLFVLLGMRRKQRMIPPYARPKNESLDFVKTLGRLYHDRKDHHNLAGKMAAYFLEHVRSTYKLPTHTLDETFVMSLHYKSGYPETETRAIIDSIHRINTSYSITDAELSDFHKQLELFYQNT
ncbi:MAG TPA: DUF4350 domain-containing protein [Flavisolibacter sp.]|nr:DUF4350 domain-containing protein [Flavisolibacter sp.]